MIEARIAQKSPYIVTVQPGSYWWCRCGRSGNQPFCDGSHKGTGFSPVKIDISEPAKIAFCGCKRTGRQPYCDGTHRTLG